MSTDNVPRRRHAGTLVRHDPRARDHFRLGHRPISCGQRRRYRVVDPRVNAGTRVPSDGVSDCRRRNACGPAGGGIPAWATGAPARSCVEPDRRRNTSRYAACVPDIRSSDASTSVRVRACTAEEIPLLHPIDMSANPVFAMWGHPEFTTVDESLPIDMAAEAIVDGRLLVCDLMSPSGDFEVIGWLVMFDRPNGETSIGQISMHADRMGHGYGKVLLQAAIDRCRRVGRVAIVLSTQDDVPWNRPWYERFGFTVVQEGDWDAAMHETTREQSQLGLDWSTRVHMRLALQ